MPERRRIRSPLAMLAALLTAGLMVGACTTSGDISNPIQRKVAWFSHLNGDDIRAACKPGAPDRLRLVHNADYSKRVRVVDAMETADGGLAMTTRVIAPARLSSGVTIGGPSSILAPWAGEVHRAGLSPSQTRNLLTALARDGLGQPTPAGTQLRSQDYWWVGVACRGGLVAFQAWADKGRGYDRLTFPAVLAKLDNSAVPMRDPAQDPRRFNPALWDKDGEGREVRFRLAVGTTGLNQ